MVLISTIPYLQSTIYAAEVTLAYQRYGTYNIIKDECTNFQLRQELSIPVSNDIRISHFEELTVTFMLLITETLLMLKIGKKKLKMDQFCTWSAEAHVGDNKMIEAMALSYLVDPARLEINREKRSSCPYENDPASPIITKPSN